MEPLLTNNILDLLRGIGDPRVDAATGHVDVVAREELIKEARAQGLARFLDGDWLNSHAADYDLKELLEQPGALPDPVLVKTACDLFARYGSEIAAALLLVALPEAYAAGKGAKVLAQRSQLIEGGALSTRRILATAQFVIWVLTPGTLAPSISADMDEFTYESFDATLRLWGKIDGQALRASLALRIMHSLIRNAKPVGIQSLGLDDSGGALPNDDIPLNQEDLLATLLSFTITVFEVLEQFGITWTAEEQEAYFYVWDHVGELLGIGDECVITKLTGSADLADLTRKLRRFDEGNLPNDAKEDLLDTAEADSGADAPDGADVGSGEPVAPAPVGAGHPSSEEVAELFKGLRNRRVLRRAADVGTLRPQSVPEARALLARLRERMWTLENDRLPETEPFRYENFRHILDDVAAGRILLRAMVDEVAARLPASQKTWPIAVMRQLVPPPVQNRLALGGTSTIGLLTRIFDAPRDVPGSVVFSRIAAEVLRLRATRIADALFLDYYDKGRLEIPGLPSAALGYGLRR